MKILILLQLLCIYMLSHVEAGYQRKWCHSCNDPHMSTTDGLNYEFQFTGDNFVLFSDFANQHVAASFRPCGGNPTPTCNCGFKFKFIDHYFVYDVCGVNTTGIILPFFVIKPNPGPFIQQQVCSNVVPAVSETDDLWWTTPGNPNTDADNAFFCAKTTGSSDTYIIRSNAGNNDAIYVKVTITSCGISCIHVSPGPNSYFNPNTGGLCGKYNDNTGDDKTIWTLSGAAYVEVAATELQMSNFWKLNRNPPGNPLNPPNGLGFLKLFNEECPCDIPPLGNTCNDLIAKCLLQFLGYPVVLQNGVCGGKEGQVRGLPPDQAERTCKKIMDGILQIAVADKVLAQEAFDKFAGWCKLDLTANANMIWAIQHAQSGLDRALEVCGRLDAMRVTCDILQQAKPAICQAADLFNFVINDPIDRKRCAAWGG